MCFISLQSLDVRASENVSDSQALQSDLLSYRFKAQNFTFFLVFFMFSAPEAGMFYNKKYSIVTNVKYAEKKQQKSASTEIQEWSENVVNVQFLKGNCEFFSAI